MKDIFNALLQDESGQGLVEYVLIIALVAVGLITIIGLFRDSIGDVFNNITGRLQAAPTSDYTPPAG